MSWRWILVALLIGFVLNLLETRKAKKDRQEHHNDNINSGT